MNILRILIPCALQRGGESEGGGGGGGCWLNGSRRSDDSRMTQRMGASASSSPAPIGGDPIQAARLSSTGNPDQLGIIVRYVLLLYLRSFLARLLGLKHVGHVRHDHLDSVDVVLLCN